MSLISKISNKFKCLKYNPSNYEHLGHPGLTYRCLAAIPIAILCAPLLLTFLINHIPENIEKQKLITNYKSETIMLSSLEDKTIKYKSELSENNDIFSINSK